MRITGPPIFGAGISRVNMSSSGRVRPAVVYNFPFWDQNGMVNTPPAATEYAPSNVPIRPLLNLAGFSQVRAQYGPDVSPGFAGSTAFIQYTVDLSGATGWTVLTGTVPTDQTGIPNGQVLTSAFVAIPAAAQGPVLLRWMFQGGNSATSSFFHLLGVEFR